MTAPSSPTEQPVIELFSFCSLTLVLCSGRETPASANQTTSDSVYHLEAWRCAQYSSLRGLKPCARAGSEMQLNLYHINKNGHQAVQLVS